MQLRRKIEAVMKNSTSVFQNEAIYFFTKINNISRIRPQNALNILYKVFQPLCTLERSTTKNAYGL